MNSLQVALRLWDVLVCGMRIEVEPTLPANTSCRPWGGPSSVPLLLVGPSCERYLRLKTRVAWTHTSI